MTTDLTAALVGLSESARSRLLQTGAERERLERVLLMLPAALSEYTPQRAVEVFAQAACETTNAHLAIVVLPELLNDPVVVRPNSGAATTPFDYAPITALATAFGGSVAYVADARMALSNAERELLGRAVEGYDVRSLLALPVLGRGSRSLGVLCLVHHRNRAFSERQVALAGALAAHLGHTIEVTDAVAEQTRISTALQTSLLPPLLPEVPGLDIAARYRPSGHGNLVGGDFYDVFPSGVERWNLLLGDSSGVGPEAAGLAGVARYTARALAESAAPPAEMLRLLNRAVLRAASEGHFCTAVLAGFTFDGEGSTVSLASAGHPPAYVQRADGSVELAMEATGMLLGFVEDASVGEQQLRLRPGDAIVLYTDGVIEARNAQAEYFGDERLRRVIASAAGRSAEGIARRIEREVLDHRGPRNSDDVAIVVARVRPIAPR